MKRVRGFTLIEILIAITIFAVMSTMAYRGLSSSLQVRERVAEENRRWRDLTLFFDRLESDLAALELRAVRDSFDTPNGLPAFQGRTDAFKDTEAALTFTRGQDGAVPLRLGYRLRDKSVELLIWPVLDQGPRTVPRTYKLLNDVAELSLRYLDGKQWRDTWPKQNQGQQGQAPALPRAVEIAVTLASGEKITRVYALQDANS
jgi:general secretion pathway protein J